MNILVPTKTRDGERAKRYVREIHKGFDFDMPKILGHLGKGIR